MADDNKVKLLKVLEIMKTTSKESPINYSGIIERLGRESITAERKSIARDITSLIRAGYHLEKSSNPSLGWYMEQTFDNYELQLLSDAVAYTRYLSAEGTRILLKKLESLTSEEAAKSIRDNTLLDDSIKIWKKPQEEEFRASYNRLQKAINENRQISFQYTEKETKGTKKLSRNGYIYQASPFLIVFLNQEYFLLTSLKQHRTLTWFRVTMMVNIEILDEQRKPAREIEEFKTDRVDQSVVKYLKKNVNLWNGNTVSVKLNCDQKCKQFVRNKFGTQISIRDLDENTFEAHISVSDGDGFFQWIASYGTKIRIAYPESMRIKYRQYLENILLSYQKEE